MAIAHYDNSLNNRFNPDPNKEVHWGDQNWDEMQSGFLGLVVDTRHQRREDLHPVRSQPAAARKIGSDAGVRLWVNEVAREHQTADSALD